MTDSFYSRGEWNDKISSRIFYSLNCKDLQSVHKENIDLTLIPFADKNSESDQYYKCDAGV